MLNKDRMLLESLISKHGVKGIENAINRLNENDFDIDRRIARKRNDVDLYKNQLKYWFATNENNGNSYIVCAANAREAKSLIKERGKISVWYLDIDKPSTHAHVFFNLEEAKNR
jgi:hypothetical protein